MNAPLSPHAVVHPDDDRTLPVVVYVLYLLGFAGGITAFIGFIMAYALKNRAGERMRSHYVFQIRTVWIGLAWMLLGGVVALIGALLVVVLVGFAFIHLATGIWALTGVWFLIRSAVGLTYAARGEAYPRPQAWLI